MNIRCFLGFHTWQYFPSFIGNATLYRDRECKLCGKKQVKKPHWRNAYGLGLKYQVWTTLKQRALDSTVQECDATKV